VRRLRLCAAISACERALTLESKDAGTNFPLGKVYTEWFDQRNSRDTLRKAEEKLGAALRLNPDFAYAPEAKRQLLMIREIKSALRLARSIRSLPHGRSL